MDNRSASDGQHSPVRRTMFDDKDQEQVLSSTDDSSQEEEEKQPKPKRHKAGKKKKHFRKMQEKALAPSPHFPRSNVLSDCNLTVIISARVPFLSIGRGAPLHRLPWAELVVAGTAHGAAGGTQPEAHGGGRFVSA